MKPHIYGRISEFNAVKFLKNKKYKILEINYFFPGGEIDIIAKIKNIYVFVEVKAKSTLKFGYPRSMVNFKKQCKIKKGALHFFRRNRIYDFDARFDVIEIVDNEINHIENAFY